MHANVRQDFASCNSQACLQLRIAGTSHDMLQTTYAPARCDPLVLLRLCRAPQERFLPEFGPLVACRVTTGRHRTVACHGFGPFLGWCPAFSFLTPDSIRLTIIAPVLYLRSISSPQHQRSTQSSRLCTRLSSQHTTTCLHELSLPSNGKGAPGVLQQCMTSGSTGCACSCVVLRGGGRGVGVGGGWGVGEAMSGALRLFHANLRSYEGSHLSGVQSRQCLLL